MQIFTSDIFESGMMSFYEIIINVENINLCRIKQTISILMYVFLSMFSFFLLLQNGI